MRIGERLVRAGHITRQQLAEALEHQVIHGARIGTNLVELGCLQLDELAVELAAQLEVPPALHEDFERADRSLQALLRAEVAAEFHAVPLRKDASGHLLVATSEPLDTAALAELSEELAGEVVLCAAPELRIFYHLEQVYDVRRPNRLLRVRTPTVRALDEDAALEWSQTEPTPKTGERRRFVRTLSDLEPPEPPTTLARIAVKRVRAGADGIVELNSFDDRMRAIRAAPGRDRVGDLVVSSLRRDFDDRLDAGVLLVIRDQVAIGWKGFVRGGRDDAVEAVAVALDEPSILLPCYRDATTYVGSPSEVATETDQRLWALLGTEPPADVVVVPVAPDNHVICLLYAHALRPGDLDAGCLRQVRGLAQATAAAFERLIRAAHR